METVHFVLRANSCVVDEYHLKLPEKCDYSHGDGVGVTTSSETADAEVPKKPLIINVEADRYMCALFFEAMSDPKNCLKYFKILETRYGKKSCGFIRINMNLIEPPREMIDFKSNEMCEQLALERRELDHAMAWFSTLGGAFSALGDTIQECAVIAGKISSEQFDLAIRLQNPLLMSRCRLYLSLSLIQQHHFQAAKRIICREYAFARKHLETDPRLISMCLGIWSKYKYDKSKSRAIQNRNVNSALSL